jgi:hypothetical protein
LGFGGIRENFTKIVILLFIKGVEKRKENAPIQLVTFFESITTFQN